MKLLWGSFLQEQIKTRYVTFSIWLLTCYESNPISKITSISKLMLNIWNPYFQYMPGIYYVYTKHMPMSPICLVYTWYIHVYTMYIQCRGHTWHIRGISMYIHGISFDVYTWYIRCISVDIPSFLFLDFSAGPCRWSHSMRTRVLVIKIGLFHAPPWQLCLGIGRPTKGSLLLLSPRRGRRWSLALRGAAGRLRGGRLGGLVLVTMPWCVVLAAAAAAAFAAAISRAAAAAAAAAKAAARAAFLVVSCSMISFRVSVGADGAGPSGLVRSLTYRTKTSRRSVCHMSSDVHSRSDIARS